jgi:hypothetical protein
MIHKQAQIITMTILDAKPIQVSKMKEQPNGTQVASVPQRTATEAAFITNDQTTSTFISVECQMK